MNTHEDFNAESPVNPSSTSNPPSIKIPSPSNQPSLVNLSSTTNYPLLQDYHLNLSPEQHNFHLSSSPDILDITFPQSPLREEAFSSPERNLSPLERLYHDPLSPLFGLASLSTEEDGGESPQSFDGNSPHSLTQPSTSLTARYASLETSTTPTAPPDSAFKSPSTSPPARYNPNSSSTPLTARSARVPRGKRKKVTRKVKLEAISPASQLDSSLPLSEHDSSQLIKESESGSSSNIEGSRTHSDGFLTKSNTEEDVSLSGNSVKGAAIPGLDLETTTAEAPPNGDTSVVTSQIDTDPSCSNVETSTTRDETDGSPPAKKRRKYKPRKHIPKTLNLRGRPRKVPVNVTKLSFDPIQDFMSTLYPHQLALNNYNPMDIPEYRELMEARDLQQCFLMSFAD